VCCLLDIGKRENDRLLLVVSDLTQIWSKESFDRGQTWSPHRSIVRDFSYGDVVETLEGDLLLFCISKDSELHLARSKDGKEWSKPDPVREVKQVITNSSACVDAKGNLWLASVAKSENREEPLLVRRSTDQGKTWEKPEEVPLGSIGIREPSVAVHDGYLFVTFTKFLPGNSKVKDVREIWAAVKDLDPDRKVKEPKTQTPGDSPVPKTTAKDGPTADGKPPRPEKDAPAQASPRSWQAITLIVIGILLAVIVCLLVIIYWRNRKTAG